ncbi:hypothetical protein GCM10009087_34490 [Sphingomonas oligophenolica]|uniref:Uncharacterized protein n=1 Tax=Sphingomonas oligophenolica TaxID=301154 RepID=A0ABU9XYZ1_9SPHN
MPAWSAPFLGTARAQPPDRGARIGRYLLPNGHADRFLGPGRGEDFHHLTIIADGALIERALDLVLGIGLASGEGPGEVRMRATPAIDRGGRHIEEIGDIGFGQAMPAQLAGLLGADRQVRVGLRSGPDVCRGARTLAGGLRRGS